jgi:hypothetical protein
MKRLGFKVFAAILSLMFMSGCHAHMKKKAQSLQPHVIANKTTTTLYCWFVVHDPNGKNGYACVDSRAGSVWVEGGGLFQSIAELRDALSELGLTNAPTDPFPSRIPDGYTVRELTPEELRFLRSK